MSCGCSKNAESCGCGSKVMNWESYDRPVRKAEEPTVQEPDFMPNGDGRAIGQQNFAINLSPLHAENEDEAEDWCDTCQKDKPIVAHVEFDGPFLSALCKECYAEHLEMGGKPNVYGAESFNAKNYPHTCNFYYNDGNRGVFCKGKTKYNCGGCGQSICNTHSQKSGASHLCEDCAFDGDESGWVAAESFNAERDEHGFLVCQECSRKLNDDEVVAFKNITLCKPCVWATATSTKWVAETTGSPSPTFNEGITGQDGPSADPTNANFSAEDSCRKCGRDMGESTVHHDVARCPYNDPTCYTCENCSNHDMCDDPDNPPCFFCGQVSCENISKTDRDECENPDFDEGEHFWAETNDKEHECHECGREWTRNNGRGCPYGDPTCFLCEKHNHNDCDYPDGFRCFFCGQVSCQNESKTDRDGCENPDLEYGESFNAETFEAMSRYAPSKSDVDAARRKIKAHSSWGEVVYDRYLVNQQGSSNKFYYTAIAENDGRFYPLGAWGRIGYMNTVKIYNALGKKENPSAHLPTMKGAYNVVKDKEMSKINAPKSVKRYVDSTLTKWDAESFNAETPKNLLTHCADCKCKLNSKNHKMDTSGSAGGVGSSNGALCDSCFVHLRKTGNFNNPVSLTQYGAESLSEIEGPTAEATAGGLHSPSSFDMTWEDGTGQSSASIPPNEIAWAENTGFPTWAKLGAGIAVLYGVGKVITARVSEQKSADNAVKARKGCCGKSAEAKTVRKNSEFSVGQINPVVVEGESDVHGAEEVKLSKPHQGPQSTHYSNERPSQKMW